MNQITSLIAEEGAMFYDAASRFALQEYGIGPAPHDLTLCRARLQRLGGLGILGLALPEDRGGFGGAAEAALALQALGPALPPEPVIEGAIIAACLMAQDAAFDQDRLDALAAGELLATVALEDATFGDQTRAHQQDGQWLLTGLKPLVRAGVEADVIVVQAQTDSGTDLFVVDAQADGLQRTSVPTLDRLPRADLRFDATPAQRLELGEGGLQLALDRGRAAYLAEMLGLMDALINATIDYAKLRKQFGQAIGRFQSISHRIADMWIAAEETRSMVMAAALACDAGTASDRQRTISSAMLVALDAARKVGAEAIQIHGGIGMTDELIVGHWYRRLWALSCEAGDRHHHLTLLQQKGA